MQRFLFRRWMARVALESYDELVQRVESSSSSNGRVESTPVVDRFLLEVAGLSDQLVITKKSLSDKETASELQKLCGARSMQTLKRERLSKLSRYVRKVLYDLAEKGNHTGGATYATALRLISGYGDKRLLLLTYDEMRKRGIPPSQSHLLYLLKAFHDARDLPGCAMVLREVYKEGLEPSMDMYRMLISCQALCNKKHEATATFEIARKKYHSSVTISLFTAYARVVENYEESMNVLSQVRHAKLSPNSSLYHTILTSLLENNNIPDCEKLMNELLSKSPSAIPLSSQYVIRMRCFSKSGNIQEIQSLFKKHCEQDVSLSLYTEYMSALLSVCSEKNPLLIDDVRQAYEACVLVGYASPRPCALYISALAIYKAVSVAEAVYSRLGEDLKANLGILQSLRDCNAAVNGNERRALELTNIINNRIDGSKPVPQSG